MQRRFRLTERLLSALPVFEAAARHGSFTRAAQELNLSQPTVSHHIRHIEEQLDIVLFARHHNRLRVTSAGEQLSAAVALGFGHVEQEIRTILSQAHPGGLTLACSMGFANGWLLPRFSGLRRAIGSTMVNVATTDWLAGYDRDAADLIIVWAGDRQSPHERVSLFPETVSPVCSPEFLARHPQLTGPCPPEHLMSLPLLHFDERDSQFMNWVKWFDHMGLRYDPPKDRYMFSNYEFLLQAVTEGEGIGLGWDHLIEELLEARSLVRIGQPIQGEETAYFLEVRRGRAPNDLLDRVIEWFVQESAENCEAAQTGPEPSGSQR